MTYQGLIEILQTSFADHLDDEVVVKDSESSKRDYAVEYLFNVYPRLDFDGKLSLIEG